MDRTEMIPIQAAIIYGIELLLVGVSLGFNVLALALVLEPVWRMTDDN